MSHDASLEPVLRAVEPAVRLVHERHLRLLVRYFTERGRALPTNTELPFWFARADLEAADLLPRETTAGTEPNLLLVTDPNDRLIDHLPRAEQLRAYWRVLVRAAVARALDDRAATGALPDEVCRTRLDALGPAAAREVRFVLESEHLVAPGAVDFERYRAFAAVYTDLAHFGGHAVEEFFPSARDARAVRAVLGDDFDAAALVARARPEGAADPEREPTPDERWLAPPRVESLSAPAASTPDLTRAEDAARKGNLVRSAILRARAAGAAPESERAAATAAAGASLRTLVDRLGDVLTWDAETRDEWHQALAPLLPRAADGKWPRAARCLYELQRIPTDLNQEVYAVDLPEALRSFGRRPVRRHLPHARPVMVLMALRKAHKQLLRAGLGEPEQLRLDRLLHHEIHAREGDLRRAFAPIITKALTASGLVPSGRAEEVARDRLVQELLDRVCARGYLRIGDLRDAVARNQLKLPDLQGFGDFWGGDALLRADAQLARDLDGVYRRGEFYLRALQRLTALFFGTRWGRAFTLFVALPFGGAFLALMFAEELRHIGLKIGALVSKSAAPRVVKPPEPAPATEPARAAEPEWQFDEDTGEWFIEDKPIIEARPPILSDLVTSSAGSDPAHAEHGHSVLIAWPTIVGFGFFLLLVFHVPPFRAAVLRALALLWRVARGVVWDAPLAVWNAPQVRAARLSRAAHLFHRHCFAPLLLTLLLLAVLFLFGFNLWFLAVWVSWPALLLLLVVYNLPFWFDLQERISERVNDWWRVVRTNLLPGLVQTVIDWFRGVANWVERQLYAVDEWMRFRGGDSRGSVAVKAVLGLIWFPIAYVTRFVFYLLVEPHVNPVKHFPVVTVSHKVIWPMVPQLAEWTGISPLTMGMIINGIPGIFGFIVWELKENWRLYAASRGAHLPSATVGSHGESVRGLLRPGFHSGTVPALFRKARRAHAKGDRAKLSHLHHELEHAGEGLHHFVARELLPLLAGAPDWNVPLKLGEVKFGVQRAEIELHAPGLGRDPFVLALENVNGEIEASVPHAGWADKLTEAQRAVFVFALRGVLDMAAATRYDGRERTEAAPADNALAALAHRVTWAQWVARWGAKG